MANGQDDGKGVDLAAITAAAVAVLGVVGSLTAAGAMQRILRNHGYDFAWALGLVVAGGTFWLFAAVFSSLKTLFRVIGAIAVAGGALWAILIASETARDVERPAISASFTPDLQRVT